jgi:hypothetical protein
MHFLLLELLKPFDPSALPTANNWRTTMVCPEKQVVWGVCSPSYDVGGIAPLSTPDKNNKN